MADNASTSTTHFLKADDTELQAALADAYTSIGSFSKKSDKALNDVDLGEQLSRDIEQAKEDIEDELEETQNIMRRFASKATGILQRIEIVNLTHTVWDLASSFVGMGSDADKNTRKLAATLKAVGDGAGWTKDQLVAMADEISASTNFDDDQAKGAQATLLTFRNIKGDQFRETLHLAADLAEVMEVDLSSAAEGLAKAMEDPGEAMLALRKAGVILTDEQVKQMKELKENGKVQEAQAMLLEEVSKRIKGVAADMTQGTAGGWTKVTKDVEDLYKAIGLALLPAVEEFMPLLTDITSGLLKMIEPANEAGGSFKDLAAWIVESAREVWDTMREVSDSVVAAFTVLTVEWDTALAYLGYATAYGVTVMLNTLEHFVTSQLPTMLDWMVTRFKEAGNNAVNAQIQMWRNMLTNAKEFLKALREYLSTGHMDFKFTGLTDGFKATWSELPALAEREADGFEKKLGQRMDAAGKKLANAYDDVFKQIHGDAEKAREDALKDKDTDLKHGALSDYTHDKGKDEKEKETKSEQGKTEGLQALAQRISEAAAKGEFDPALAEAKKQTKELEDLVEIEEDSLRLQADLQSDMGIDDTFTNTHSPSDMDHLITALDDSIKTDWADNGFWGDNANALDLQNLANGHDFHVSPQNPNDPFNDTGFLPSPASLDFWRRKGVELRPDIAIPQDQFQVQAALNGGNPEQLKALLKIAGLLEGADRELAEAIVELSKLPDEV